MPGPTRREVIARSAQATFAVLAGCGPGDGGDSGPGPSCTPPDDPVPGGAYIGTVPFVDESGLTPGEVHGEGLDARQTADLALLTEADPLMTNEMFYVRTAASALLDVRKDWTIAVTGLAEPVTLHLADLLGDVVDQGAVVLECSGNTRSASFGLLSAATWAGIPLSAVFARLAIDSRATRVRIVGFDAYPTESTSSSPGCDWIFRLDELDGAFLATEMNGEPLPLDHGFPVRLIVPGWYGCCHPKWVDTIEFVDDDAPATTHMQEFAVRTQQAQVWTMARDFTPGTMDQSALPVRVEMWRVGDRMAYKLVGILWGGQVPTDRLVIGFNGGPKVPVDSCPPATNGRMWTIWSHLWFPDAVGAFTVDLAIDDPTVVQRRLDSGWYLRTVYVPET